MLAMRACDSKTHQGADRPRADVRGVNFDMVTDIHNDHGSSLITVSVLPWQPHLTTVDLLSYHVKPTDAIGAT